MRCSFPRQIRHWAVLSTVGLSSLASAQLAVFPGQQRDNVAGTGLEIERTTGSDVRGFVGFSRNDALTQSIHVGADATSLKSATARGRAILYADFCVPRSGMATCDSVSDPTAPDILVNLTFRYGMVGEVISQFGSSASFAASASVIDRERNQFVAYQALGSLSVSQGQVKTIAEVPIVLPNFASAKVTLPVTFTSFLRRGKVYRFQLSAATTATSSAMRTGLSNFNTFQIAHPAERGRVQLHNLSIRVEQEAPPLDVALANLRAAVESLTSQVGALGDRIDLMTEQWEGHLEGMQQALFDLSQRTAGPGGLLLRIEGTPPPDGAQFVGRIPLIPDDPSGQRGPMRAEVYLVKPENRGAALRPGPGR